MFKQIIKALRVGKKAGGAKEAVESMKTVSRTFEVAVRGSEKVVEKVEDVLEDDFVVIAAPVLKLKEIVARPGSSNETSKRVRAPKVESTTYFQVDADAPPVPEIKSESLQKLVTYFHVAVDAPPVPIIPARFLEKTAASTPIKADIDIATPVQSASVTKKPSPLRLVSTATSPDAIAEEDEEEKEEKVEFVPIKYEIKIPVKKATGPALIMGKSVLELLHEAQARRVIHEVNWDDFDEPIEEAPAPAPLDLSLYDIAEEDEE
jgi:hypothetical protein